jgi:quercetin dioxygenase-like cupin family protein
MTEVKLQGDRMRIFLSIWFVCGALLLSVMCAPKAAAQSAGSIPQQPDSVKFPIDKYLNEFTESKIEKTDAGYQYWFVDRLLADGKTLKMSVVKPHSATHRPHVHPEEEFFFVLEGKVEFYLDGQRKVVGPYASLYCPPNVEHGIRNVGDTEAKYLVIKKYPKQ